MQHCNIHVATWPQALHLAFITSSFTGRVSALFFHFNLLRVLSAVGKEAAPFRTLEPCRYLSLPVATCRDRCDQATRAHRSRKLGLWSHFGPHVLLGERVPRDGSGETRTWGSPEALMSMKQRRPGKRIRGISLFSYDSKWFETVFIYDDLWWFMILECNFGSLFGILWHPFLGGNTWELHGFQFPLGQLFSSQDTDDSDLSTPHD